MALALLAVQLFAAASGRASAPLLIPTELLIPVSTRTGVGKVVYVRALSDWQSPACRLRAGGILRGRIVATVEHTRRSKIASLAMVFESAECANGKVVPLPLTLVALSAPGPAAENASPPLTDAVGISIGESGGPAGRSMTTAALTGFFQMGRDEKRAAVAPGSVIGLRGLKLSVGSGPEGSSVLSRSGQGIRLERGSEFFLATAAASPPVDLAAEAPRAAAIRDATSAPSGIPVPAEPPAAPASVPAAEPPDETEICSPPNCSVDLPNAGLSATAEASFSIAGFGYAPRRTREDYRFDHEAAIAYLGPDELLCTFNPHTLVPRNASEPAARIIRALLIDLRTMHVRRTVEWRIPDDRQYLWPMAGNRVLVHLGNQLRSYGPGLKQERTISLGGPLAFLSSAPSGNLIAVGITHERHSPEMHRQLLEALGEEPQEDIELRLVDADFRILGSWIHPGALSAPTLSDGGEIRLAVHSRQTQWSIVEYGWNKERHVLATFTSACRPDTTTLPPDLLLLSGCARITLNRRYRVLGPDGKTILQMNNPPSGMTKSPRGTDSGPVFALAFAQPIRSMIPESSFSASDLRDELVSVFEARGGKRLAQVRVADPAATDQSFALSPNGAHLAVLAGHSVSFYAVPLPDVRGPANPN